jgi:hypothetical protein
MLRLKALIPQTRVGETRVVIYMIIYSDGTALNSFGTAKSWPVYVWFGNVPEHIRLARGKGGAILLGYLPQASN